MMTAVAGYRHCEWSIVRYPSALTRQGLAERPYRNFLSCEEKFVDIQLWNAKSYDDCCSISSLHQNECGQLTFTWLSYNPNRCMTTRRDNLLLARRLVSS